MVPNGSAYDNYPSFANNGTKTPPGGSTESAKYALGMVPADTFPAEWANYLFHGATAGITRLNSDTGSIKKEINSVLSNFNITPDATVNTQLMEALNKLKAEAALAAHPVGSLYWTSVNENPATTFGGGTWVQIKDKFILAAGNTYSNGATGGAATVTLTTSQIPSHRHSFTPSGSVTVSTNPTFTGTPVASGANDRGHTHTINNGNTSSSGTTTTAGIRHNGSTGNMSANSTGYIKITDTSNGAQFLTDATPTTSGCLSLSSFSNASTIGNGSGSASTAHQMSINVEHTHSMPASYIYGKTDGESQSHYHNVTAQGTISGGSYSFGGTASNTGYNGDGGSHENMPPYIVKYCWERTA